MLEQEVIEILNTWVPMIVACRIFLVLKCRICISLKCFFFFLSVAGANRSGADYKQKNKFLLNPFVHFSLSLKLSVT